MVSVAVLSRLVVVSWPANSRSIAVATSSSSLNRSCSSRAAIRRLKRSLPGSARRFPISSRNSAAIATAPRCARAYLSGVARAVPMNSMMSSDHALTSYRRSCGTPIIAMITSAGSGIVKSATRSASLLPARSVSNLSMIASICGLKPRMVPGRNALLTRPRTLVWSGGSRKMIHKFK